LRARGISEFGASPRLGSPGWSNAGSEARLGFKTHPYMLRPGESGTERLEEAVAAYRDALEELTHERVPLDWAATQNNLGNALTTLGERESGTARLEEAVAAYRDALEELTRENAPQRPCSRASGETHGQQAKLSAR
jgi:exonuclease VII small subunit